MGMQTHRGEKGDNDARPPPPPNAIGYIQMQKSASDTVFFK